MWEAVGILVFVVLTGALCVAVWAFNDDDLIILRKSSRNEVGKEDEVSSSSPPSTDNSVSETRSQETSQFTLIAQPSTEPKPKQPIAKYPITAHHKQVNRKVRRDRPNDSGELRRQISAIGTIWGEYNDFGLFPAPIAQNHKPTVPTSYSENGLGPSPHNARPFAEQPDKRLHSSISVRAPQAQPRNVRIGRKLSSLPGGFPNQPPVLTEPDNRLSEISSPEQRPKGRNNLGQSASPISKVEEIGYGTSQLSEPFDLQLQRQTKTKESVRQFESNPETEKRMEEVSAIANRAIEEYNRISPNERMLRYENLDVTILHDLASGSADPAILTGPVRKFSTEYSTRVNAILNLGIEVFHFTSIANKGTIEKKGLYSTRQLSTRGITPKYISSVESRRTDALLKLDDFVHLTFTTQAKMAYVVKQRSDADLAWFRVSPLVLQANQARFCRNYANKTGAKQFLFSTMSDLDLIALAIGFPRIGYWQALVRDAIPPSMIQFHSLDGRRR